MAATAPEMTSDVYYWLIRYEAECGRKLDSAILARMTGKTVNAASLTVGRMKKKFEGMGYSLDGGSAGSGGAGAAEEGKQAKAKRASPKKRKAEALDEEEEAGRQKVKTEATDGGDSGTEC